MARHGSIQDNHAYFVDKLKVDTLLTYLRDKKWLTADEFDTLSSGQFSRRQKAEKILLLLPRKTTASFKAEEILVECTIWSGQYDLVKKLGYSDDEIREISKRNPSGTKPVHDAPGHGYADHSSYTEYGGQSSMGYTGQGNHMGYSSYNSYDSYAGNYGQTQYVGVASVQQGGTTGYSGATGYSGSSDSRRVEVGPSVIIYTQGDDADDAIQMLVTLLRKSGVDCDIDQYHTNEKINNWDRWWEKKVREIAEQNGFILLVCSPDLRKGLLSNDRIQMKEGSISCNLLSSLIEDSHTNRHIVPVFVDQFTDCIPMSLSQRKHYELMLHNLVQFDLENITFDQMVGLPEFESLVSLTYKLTGVPEVEKPPVMPQIPRIPRPVKASTVPIQESMGHGDLVTDRDIPHFVEMLRRKDISWSKLAVRLKMPTKKISQIRNEHPSYNKACTAMLQKWLAEVQNPLTRQELEDLIAGL